MPSIKQKLPELSHLGGFMGLDSKISLHPSENIVLSPIAEIAFKQKQEVTLEVKRRRIRQQHLAYGLTPPEIIEVELTSGDDSAKDSAVSEDGILDFNLDFVTDENVFNQVAGRRRYRRLMKAKNQTEFEAIKSVVT